MFKKLMKKVNKTLRKIQYWMFKIMEKLKLVRHCKYQDIVPSEVKPFGKHTSSKEFKTTYFAGTLDFKIYLQTFLDEDYFCSKDGRILFDYKKSIGEESVRRLYVLSTNIGNIFFINEGKYIDLGNKNDFYTFKIVDNTYIYKEYSDIDTIPKKVEHFSINTEALNLHKKTVIAESGEEITDDYLSVLDMYKEEAVLLIEKYLEDNIDSIIERNTEYNV